MKGKQEDGQLTKQKQNTLVKKGECQLTTRYEQIVHIDKIGAHTDFDMNEVMRMAANEQIIKAAVTDRKKRLLLLVNYQKDFFREDLFDIPDVKDDAKNISKFIYDNLGKISRIITSLDVHIAQQIYHPCWWVDKDGNNPKPYTFITSKDVSSRKWMPTIGPIRDNLQYIRRLEREEGHSLCIWPYYAISGTEGSCMENEISKMVYFHSVVRNSINNVIWNGLDFYTQAYGCINTEFMTKTSLNLQLLLAVEKYSEIFIAGETANHGILDTVNMIARYYAKDPDITKKITILTDCTSSMSGYEKKVAEEFESLNKNFGIKFKKSTEIKF